MLRSRADLATRTDELAEIMQKYRRGYKREVEEWRERVVSLSAAGKPRRHLGCRRAGDNVPEHLV